MLPRPPRAPWVPALTTLSLLTAAELERAR